MNDKAPFARNIDGPESPQPPTAIHDLRAARPVIQPDLLSYHLLRPQNSGPGEIPLLGEAYRCWSEVWQSTFLALGKTGALPSDDFTRQDEIGALFHERECIATTSFRWIDLSNPIYAHDSYFTAWSADALRAAASEGPRICISSSFTVATRWRRPHRFPLNQLLGALVVERFLQSGADTLVGTMRNDVGMNKLTYRLGFEAVQREAMQYGGAVDLVAFYRTRCTRPLAHPAVEDKVRELLRREVADA